jgi:hypothetical protein
MERMTREENVLPHEKPAGFARASERAALPDASSPMPATPPDDDAAALAVETGKPRRRRRPARSQP